MHGTATTFQRDPERNALTRIPDGGTEGAISQYRGAKTLI
jgi:hypothetical protein